MERMQRMQQTLTARHARSLLPPATGRGEWDVSAPLGSMGTTRVARRGSDALVVKLTATAHIDARLAELGVVPEVLEAGEGHLVQRFVDGPHPDHRWFADHLPRWADLVRAYLDDAPLAALVDAAPERERLTVATAADFWGQRPGPGWPGPCAARFEEWQHQAPDIADYAPRPTHADVHMLNIVLDADDRPYLLDWDQIDHSDPMRDLGVQAWGLLPRPHWTEFTHRTGLPPDEPAICWWNAFKMLRTALWVDDGSFHAMLFERSVRGMGWVGEGHEHSP